MAMDKEYNLYDFYNGTEDLKNNLVRCNNEDTFKQDPLRILRAIRMSGKYKFKIDEITYELMIKHKELINNVAKERIATEINYIMVYDDIYNIINDNKEIFFTLIPELENTYSFNQNNPYHIYDLYNHILNVIKNVSPILEVRLAALFHDLGKLKTYSEDENGIGHFYGHPAISSKIAKTTLKKYKYDNKTIDVVSKLVEFHELQITYSKKSIRRLLNKFGKENIDLLFQLRRSDILSQNPKFKDRIKDLDRMYKITKEIIANDECFTLKQLAINGNDLISIGISNGATIGKILDDCLNNIIEGNLPNDRTLILEYVKKEYIN
jgi:tRNA nucleotidyltransferase (CCA-adding enzyme)